MAKWSKKRADTWMRAFIEKNKVVPSSSLRDNYGGPPDEELKRHWGGVREALEAVGAPMGEASMHGYGNTKFYYANGHLTGTMDRERRVRQAHAMTVRCAVCDWEELHDTAERALRAQDRHLRSHGTVRKRKKWRNGPNKPVPGTIPGVRSI